MGSKTKTQNKDETLIARQVKWLKKHGINKIIFPGGANQNE